MSDKYFVDTNILVYARDRSAGERHVAALDLMTGLWKTRSGRLSIQVLNEYFVTVTRKLNPGLSATKAWADIESLNAWEPVSMDWSLLCLAREVYQKHRFSWWDAMIVAAAQQLNCSKIYSEDLSHMARYGKVTVINPFK